MEVYTIKKTEEYRLYLVDTGDFGVMTYSDGNLFVLFDMALKGYSGGDVKKENITVKYRACYRFKTGKVVTPENWITDEINDKIIEAAYKFVAVK